MSEMESVVIVDELKTSNGDFTIGRLTLNKPKALNALDLTMAEIMLKALQQWQTRSDVVAVTIDAAGGKAFCAGGDIVSMYRSMVEAQGHIPQFLETFFETEYTLDYTIHNYSKPIIVWGSGIVMGGGMGLLCGASHRVVTETSRLAMPEITIGLYPDVGGSYFLPRLPGKSGLFLGLTGGQMNGADARFVGLADALVASSEKDALLQKLSDYSWNETDGVNFAEAVSEILDSLQAPDTLPSSNVEPNMALIDDLCSPDNVTDIVNAILGADMSQDKWLSRAQSTLAKGSPITMHLVYEQCKRGANMTLADCFRMEADMSCRCGESGEFQEGVRALLIDKDMSPKWKYENVEDVPEEVVDHFFTSPWPEDKHPLSGL
ncbi:enoyl-CoA hydratase/isomerase family protein [Alteromonas sp. ALT199]|uniref:enoyl-CoA hydratase/isomerase family protein n=1 Tax=unclassified Alteromonas TaxID=2614992 RepID=UPI001BE59AAF|nr:enoyl-CoA hydratase/isomerase family protein [Alteromonas sp. ALT199]MBT3137342.1 enoyl-CoA hydratase/isomerase family protein [Alteromonas sp. ALT199]